MAVTFDAVGPDATGSNSGTASSWTWSHTCSGSSRVLFALVSIHKSPDTGISISSVTYNGTAMTSVLGPVHSGGATSFGFVELFYLINPDTGANTVSVSITGGTAVIIGGSCSFNGASQNNPLGNTATATGTSVTPSVAISSATGNMVVDGVCQGNSVNTSTQTIRWNKNVGTNSGAGNAAQSTANGAASVTMSYSSTSSDVWAMIAVSVAQLEKFDEDYPFRMQLLSSEPSITVFQ